MKLTPLDIHHKEFRVALRGYNQEEVDGFLDEVADEFERLFKENIDLSEKLDAASDKVRAYADMEKTLHNTMLAAQQSAEEIKAKAAKESELLLRDAEIKAKELVQSALAQKQRTQSEFLRIKQVEDEFRMSFRNLLEEHMRNLHAIPVSGDVAEMVGISQGGDAAPAAPQAAPRPTAPEAPEPAAPRPAAPEVTTQPAPDEPVSSYADAVAAAGTPADEAAASGRPRAQARRGAQAAPEPPAPGFVQSVQLGELGAPDLGPDMPTYGEAPEFTAGRFGAVGEREDDMDIEEID